MRVSWEWLVSLVGVACESVLGVACSSVRWEWLGSRKLIHMYSVHHHISKPHLISQVFNV